MKQEKNRKGYRPFQRIASGFMALAMSFSFVPVTYGAEGTSLLEEDVILVETEPEVVSETELAVSFAEEEQGASEEFVTFATETLSTTPLEGAEQDGVTVFDTQKTDSDIVIPQEKTHWSQPYLDDMVSYGIMRPQDVVDPDKPMTRAEFMAVINRAYNYTDRRSSLPFVDVLETDWFYDDVNIATTAGFISGTTATTAEPYSMLTRETTAYILGKNLMLSTVFGEDLNFTDSREVSSWSRALVRSASEYGLMAGYQDGTFRPQSNITVGEISTLVKKAIGTPILQSGEVSLGEVMGNVTITQSGTILKNTVIVGDLHISNGVGLGFVTLENVTVLGRIVVSGGESNAGEESILLRNVVANELVIDNMDQQKVSVRVDGNTYIENTYVRTNAYVEDTTDTLNGLRNIEMDAQAGTVLDLSGRIKEVTNTSANTTIRVVAGTVDKLTIDETATEVITEIQRGAEVLEFNIDVATDVVGDGDIKDLNLNADGAVVEMLPDNVVIRPGVTGNIFGEDMDHLTAEEYSKDPLILSGYPVASDVAPTNLNAIFATNKTGTVYWAVSNLTQGSVSVDDLIKPPSYGHIAVTYSSIDITVAEEEFIAPIIDLPIGGDYYLSAVLVDAHGNKSPLKVIAFSTPDDTIPAFAEGYPYMSDIGNTSAQVAVMATKDCVLYYAVMPKGAMPPTGDDFLSGSVSGSLSGKTAQALTKNKSMTITVSTSLLELTEYDLYLWLTDADGMNSSEVELLSFKTIDKTPPNFVQDLQTTSIGVSDVGFSFSIDEDGTLYWAVVEAGTYYPKPQAGDTSGNLSVPLNDPYAAYAVMWGIGAMFSGEVPATANTVSSFVLNGLGLETAYDIYYVAWDSAGNASTVGVLSFNTIDNTPPTFVEQNFSQTANSGEELQTNPQPYASTDITLVFSEGIQSTNSGLSFMQMYKNVESADEETMELAKSTLGTALEYSFPFFTFSGNSRTAVQVRNENYNASTDPMWVIDYRNAIVELKDGQMHITFPTKSDLAYSALNLSAGVTYGFVIQNIRDSSSDANGMTPPTIIASAGNEYGLYTFTTVYAQIMLGSADVMVGSLPYARDDDGKPKSNAYAVVDADLQVTPSDMGNVDERVVFELRMNPDAWVSYNMYMRVVDASGKHTDEMLKYYPTTPSLDYFSETGDAYAQRIAKVKENFIPDDNGWIFLNMDDVEKTANGSLAEIQGDKSGMGVGFIYSYLGYQEDTMPYPFLYELSDDYQFEFVFEVTKFNSSTTRGEWNGFLNIGVQVWAGNYTNIKSIGGHGSPSASTYNSLSLVSTPSEYTTEIIFTDSIPPYFNDGAPQIKVEDISGLLDVALTRQGELSYVIVPSESPSNLGPKDNDGNPILEDVIPDINAKYFNKSLPWPNPAFPTISSPTGSDVLGQVANPGTGVIAGSVSTGINTVTIEVEDLDPLTEYYIYFVMKSDSGGGYSDVYMAKFTTLETQRPQYKNIQYTANADVTFFTHVDSDISYVMLTYANLTQNANLKNLLDNFEDHIEKFGTAEEKAAWEASTYYTSTGDPMTTLQSMTTMFDSNANEATSLEWSDDYTVFDVYAPASLKNLVHEWIAAGANNNAGYDPDFETEKDVYTSVNRTDKNDNPDIEYVYLMSGRNVNSPNSGTEGNAANTRSFRALTGVKVSDTEFPRITDVRTTIVDVTEDAYDGPRYSGTVAITFDKSIYAMNPLTSMVYPVQVKDSDSYENQLDLAGLIGIVPPTNTDNNVVTVIREQSNAVVYVFQFKNFTDGDYIYLFNGYSISNKDGVARGPSNGGNPLQINFNATNETSTSSSSVSTTIDPNTGDTHTTTTTTTNYSKDLYWSTSWEDYDTYTQNSIPITKTESKDTVVVTPAPPAGDTTAQVMDLKLSGDSQVLVGNSTTLTLTADGQAVSANDVTWKLSNTNTSYVSGAKSASGYAVTAKYAGEYTVTATYNKQSTSFKITVPKPTITIVNQNSTVNAGQSGSMTVSIGNVGDISALTGSWSVSGTTGGTPNIANTNVKNDYSSGSKTQRFVSGKNGTVYYTAPTQGTGKVTFSFAGATAESTYSVVTSGGTGATIG